MEDGVALLSKERRGEGRGELILMMDETFSRLYTKKRKKERLLKIYMRETGQEIDLLKKGAPLAAGIEVLSDKTQW